MRKFTKQIKTMRWNDNIPARAIRSDRFLSCDIQYLIYKDIFKSHLHFSNELSPNVGLISSANGSDEIATFAPLQLGLAARPRRAERKSRFEDQIIHGSFNDAINMNIYSQTALEIINGTYRCRLTQRGRRSH